MVHTLFAENIVLFNFQNTPDKYYRYTLTIEYTVRF